MSHTLTTGNFPVPVAPSTFSIGPGTGYFVVGSTSFPIGLNQMMALAAVLGQVGPSGYGIASGLALTAVASTLNVVITAGICFVGKVIEFVASGAVAPYQLNLPVPKAMSASMVNYVWMQASGALYVSTSMTPPAGPCFFLGTVTAGATSITSIDFSGVVYWVNGVPVRYCADINSPIDSPPASMPGLLTVTSNALYRWNGTAHTYENPGIQYQTIGSNLALTPSSFPTQYITATADGLYVVLPPLADMPNGWTWRIVNYGPSGHNIGVKANAADGSTILVHTTGGASPMTPGSGITIPIVNQNGVNTYPASSPYTPGAPVATVASAP